MFIYLVILAVITLHDLNIVCNHELSYVRSYHIA